MTFHFCLRARSPALPPGPPAYPLIGNLLSFPMKHPWIHLATFAGHRDLVFFHGLGNNILILNSLDSMLDLLVRRGSVYSARPFFVVACELMDLIKCTAFLPFGHRWKLHRKLSRIALNPQSVRQYEDILSDIANRLTESLCDDPDAFAEHVRLAAGRVLLSTMYGIDAQSADDPYLKMAKTAMDMVRQAVIPVAFLVDLIPALKYILKWVPSMTFKHVGNEGRIAIADCVQKPFDHVKRGIESGLARPSFTRAALTEDQFSLEREKDKFFETELKWAAATMFAGLSFPRIFEKSEHSFIPTAGQELISATIMKLILAMATNPDKLKLAQDELKVVVGPRLPIVKDRDNLPYVDAIIKETLRWHVSLPMSLVRSSIQDDIYQDYLIPKGTTIVPNVWVIAQEMNGKHDPDEFIPERFLGDQPAINPSNYVFGFGKRMCPGKLLAEDAIFLLAATLLMRFTITPKLDDNGKEIPIDVEYSSGLLSLPSEFQCTIKPYAEA
ncbi:O-methylsterigmatocystin oxidoreductase [Termitomyces sp. J132]|nr:hypothetical protein H2248_011251 [Termitomyces sp. 'cryptogamus']KNZ77054.1 O-methylsterigmatocystin oxidoreductase [Termitomyces sp. J132]